MTKERGESLADIFAEEEARLTAEAKEEAAREQAAWDALPAEEQARIIAEREAKFAALADAIERQGEEPDEDEDEAEGEDE